MTQKQVKEIKKEEFKGCSEWWKKYEETVKENF